MSQQTFYSTIIRLQAQQAGSLPATQGRLANAAFLRLIEAVDPELAGYLHDSNQRKPFTVSPLNGFGKPHNGRVKLPVGQQLWLRFTLLNSQLFTTLTAYLLSVQAAWPKIRLGDISFIITEMLTTPGSHPWANYNSVEQLIAVSDAEAQRDDLRDITIEFASPTVFSFGKRDGLGKWMEPFPTPELFFGSLASVWNHQIEKPAVDSSAIQEYAKQTVAVGLYRMKSQVFRYWGQPQIGAVGEVSYQLRDRDNLPLRQWLNRLANFAFYSGVGYKTTMGMGQVRRRVS